FSGISDYRPWAIKLTLETLGRERGWVRRQKDRVHKPPGDKPPTPKAQRPTEPEPLRADLLRGECPESAQRTQAKLQAILDLNKGWVVKFVLLKLGRARGYVKAPSKKPTMVRIPSRELWRLTPEERAEYEKLRAIGRGEAPAAAVEEQPNN